MIGSGPGRHARRESPPPPQLPRWVRAVVSILGLFGRLPAPLRPAVWGAVIVGAMILIRVPVVLATNPAARSWSTVVAVIVALGVGAYCGAIGGFVYHLVRIPFKRLGRAGNYLTGVAIMYGYFIALAVPLIATGQLPRPLRPENVLSIVVVVTLFGLAMGHFWFREATRSRP